MRRIDDWEETAVTDKTTSPRTGYLLLPSSTDRKLPGRVLVRPALEKKVQVLRVGRRSDAGAAAWADAEIVNASTTRTENVEGSAEPKVRHFLDYAPAGIWRVIRYSRPAKLQASVAILVFAAAVLSAFVAFAGTNGGHVAAWSAFALLLLTLLATLGKFFVDVKGSGGS